MNIVDDIREKQKQLIVMINTTFDEIVNEVKKSQNEYFNYDEVYESVFPLTNTTGFKGKKPIAVQIENEKIITPTWKVVVETILNKVLEDDTMKKRVMALRDRLLGRVRKRLSDTPLDMRSPLQLCENLYIETHYDTETLMNLLLQILNEIKFDYNEIKIIIKN